MRLKPRLIIANHVGQLGNSLLLSAHVMAAAIENDFKLVNISFGPYAHLFGATRRSLFCGYPACSSFPPETANIRGKVAHACRLLRRYLSRYGVSQRYLQRRVQDVSITWDEWCDLDDPAVIGPMRERHFVVLDGWHFRAPVAVERQAPAIRRFFRPLPAISRAASSVVAAARQNCEILVGVHVRQGDYAKWRNGRFCFDTHTYARWMSEMAAIFPGRKVRFLVCSNEGYEPADFGELSVSTGSRSGICDLHVLASCDYVIGPPSTFSLWASFFGGVPLLHMMDVGQAIRQLDEFRVDTNLRWMF